MTIKGKYVKSDGKRYTTKMVTQEVDESILINLNAVEAIATDLNSTRVLNPETLEYDPVKTRKRVLSDIKKYRLFIGSTIQNSHYVDYGERKNEYVVKKWHGEILDPEESLVKEIIGVGTAALYIGVSSKFIQKLLGDGKVNAYPIGVKRGRSAGTTHNARVFDIKELNDLRKSLKIEKGE